mmetsp:Transcript_27031/g.46113  ORF Transcript_27031/g.46113 Transcript_27031/m.46113 type:complete len:375 (+) Transcript_27031:188-1312(+)|eukprot:CAMPEP_0183729698 /NCGR_PEP_ID=MMETSP0737-20130205/30969_1 /TAXON_ID=385413 /ORGANISM="Thalassiosira miniscula, Strain CCMP1093" /LENGTH=374 /DNA_ID=CAMNT_0025961959 /DNA_START=46 /DNA_END=1170 /DNA_ORIENTATION=+
MSNPPLDAPPFQPATVRICVQNDAIIQNQNVDEPQEILILTPEERSVDEFLNPRPINDEYQGDDSESEDFSSEDEMEEEGETMPMRGYWLRELRRQNDNGGYRREVYYTEVVQRTTAGTPWVWAGEVVAIKRVSWQDILAAQNRLSEDFVKEVAALQYISDWHNAELGGMPPAETHILTADIIMADRMYLYIVMPFCARGDLSDCLNGGRMAEDDARFWFQQILTGLETLQQMQICHKDLSPENLIILENRSLVIDFGMCLRIPYSTAGRHLITGRHPCGKMAHIAPEILFMQHFDGHAVDIWAAGTILFYMLTGERLENPPLVDSVFDGYTGSDLGISDVALDLLRRMHRFKPSDRLSLAQVRDHPWVQNEVP